MRGGNDTIFGQNGNDRIYGGDGADTIEGDSGDDRIEGNAGDDNIRGDGGNDRLLGQEGNDVLRGGGGHDFINGGIGDDNLRGNNGNDTMRGEEGADALRGGGGNDYLIYDADNVLMNGQGGFDTIAIGGGFGGNIDAGDSMFRNIEAFDLTGYQVTPDIALENILFVERSDVRRLNGPDELYVTGDAGLDEVVSGDFTSAERVGTTNVGGVDYAHFNNNNADLFVQVGLELNGSVII